MEMTKKEWEKKYTLIKEAQEKIEDQFKIFLLSWIIDEAIERNACLEEGEDGEEELLEFLAELRDLEEGCGGDELVLVDWKELTIVQKFGNVKDLKNDTFFSCLGDLKSYGVKVERS